jgi:hypothetical protein
MSGLFEERERGYEAKWAHDQKTLFNIQAERNRELAAWAAEKMKLPASEATDYAEAVMAAWLSGKGADPVVDKIRRDFEARKIVCPQAELSAKMKELFAKAEKRIAAST